jgi:hypothetical protein
MKSLLKKKVLVLVMLVALAFATTNCVLLVHPNHRHSEQRGNQHRYKKSGHRDRGNHGHHRGHGNPRGDNHHH